MDKDLYNSIKIKNLKNKSVLKNFKFDKTLSAENYREIKKCQMEIIQDNDDLLNLLEIMGTYEEYKKFKLSGFIPLILILIGIGAGHIIAFILWHCIVKWLV